MKSGFTQRQVGSWQKESRQMSESMGKRGEEERQSEQVKCVQSLSTLLQKTSFDNHGSDRLSCLSQGLSCSALCVQEFYLGDARDDVGVFAGVVFLVAAEYSNLAALQNMNLWGGGNIKNSMNKIETRPGAQI